MLCLATKLPLFNALCWKESKSMLQLVEEGYLSDPPGVQLYVKIGEDKDGLVLYRCFRGTNTVEGGVHQNMIKSFGSYNAGPELALLLKYIL
jgi:hypothetical protein